MTHAMECAFDRTARRVCLQMHVRETPSVATARQIAGALMDRNPTRPIPKARDNAKPDS